MRALGRTSTADYTLREFLLQGNKPNFSEPRRIYHYHFQVIYLLTLLNYNVERAKVEKKINECRLFVGLAGSRRSFGSRLRSQFFARC